MHINTLDHSTDISVIPKLPDWSCIPNGVSAHFSKGPSCGVLPKWNLCILMTCFIIVPVYMLQFLPLSLAHSFSLYTFCVPMNVHYEDWKYAKRLKKPAGGSRELLDFISTPRVIAVPVFRHTVFLSCTHNIIPPGKADCKLSVPLSLCVRLPYPVGITFRLNDLWPFDTAMPQTIFYISHSSPLAWVITQYDYFILLFYFIFTVLAAKMFYVDLHCSSLSISCCFVWFCLDKLLWTGRIIWAYVHFKIY